MAETPMSSGSDIENPYLSDYFTDDSASKYDYDRLSKSFDSSQIEDYYTNMSDDIGDKESPGFYGEKKQLLFY